MQAIAHVVEIPFRREYRTATQAESVRRSVILQVSENGLTGWGEFPELPGYSPETIETALAAIGGRPVTHSNPLAVAAARMAIADLTARRESRSLAEHLGASPGLVEVGAVVAAVGDIEAALAAAAIAVAAGFKKVKVKINPGFDLEPLAAVRAQHPGIVLAADANGAYPPGADLSFLDRLGLAYIEQPFPATAPWEASSTLRSAIDTPVCLDESITGPPTARSAIATSACDLINLKPARLTGFETARAVHDMAVDAGIGLLAGGLLETAVGRAHALSFARLPGFTAAADLAPPAGYLEADLSSPALSQTDGVVELIAGPGIGFEPDTDQLERFTVTSEPIELDVNH